MNDFTKTTALTGATTRRNAARRAPHSRPAFTLAEAVISVAVVGLMLVAALNTLGASAMSRRLTTQQRDALILADDLMGEILAKPYADPTSPGSLGPETGETATTTRAAFDDADDYNNWKATPPEAPDGTMLKLGTDYSRAVSVQWATYASETITTNTTTDTGLLAIRVIIADTTDDNRVLSKLKAFKTADFGWLTDTQEPIK